MTPLTLTIEELYTIKTALDNLAGLGSVEEAKIRVAIKHKIKRFFLEKVAIEVE